jgi:hypothetical protein
MKGKHGIQLRANAVNRSFLVGASFSVRKCLQDWIHMQLTVHHIHVDLAHPTTAEGLITAAKQRCTLQH